MHARQGRVSSVHGGRAKIHTPPGDTAARRRLAIVAQGIAVRVKCVVNGCGGGAPMSFACQA
jgi:hypothetical protein